MPTSPATAKIVTTYGSMSMNSLGTGEPMTAEHVLQVRWRSRTAARRAWPGSGPTAEDHGGEGDEAGAGRHLLVERADRAEREERAAEAGDRAGEGDVPEPGAVDLDADGVGGLRVLADGAEAQAPLGLEEPDVDGGDGDVHEVDDDRLPEQHRPDDRDVARAAGSAMRLEPRRRVQQRRRSARSTCEKKKLVRPMTSTLSTTPTMTWSTKYLIENAASTNDDEHAGDHRGDEAEPAAGR